MNFIHRYKATVTDFGMRLALCLDRFSWICVIFQFHPITPANNKRNLSRLDHQLTKLG